MALPPPTALNLNPILVLTVLAQAGALVWLGRRAPAWSRGQKAAAAGALALLVAVWLTPVATVAQHYLLSSHLLQVTVVMGVVPPLLLLALPRHPRMRVPRLLSAVLRILVHPLVAIIAVNAAFFGWHLTAPFSAAMGNDWLSALQQLSLLLASIAFWWPIITPYSPPIQAMTPLLKMGYILLATIPQTFGGLAVALAHHSLYPLYEPAPRLFGIDVLTDQQIAGASIALVSKVALFTAFIVIFMHALDSGVHETDDGGGDGGIGPVAAPPPLPSGAPNWLLDLRKGRTVREPSLPPRVRVPAGSGSGRA